MKYDVIIVGGGPAGSTAGVNLVGIGASVLLLDRAHFPRVKPCGGGISYRVYKRFPYLNQVFENVPANFVHRVFLESPSGHSVETESCEPLYAMIRRWEFDTALVDACRRGGIEIRQGLAVINCQVNNDCVRLVSSSGEEFTADLVIAADGVNSVIAVHAGFRGPWAPAAVALDATEETPSKELSAPQDTMFVYYGINGGYGYGYVFPKAGHVNFGIGYRLDYYRQHISRSPYDEHRLFMRHLQATRVLEGRSQRENFHAYLVPLAGPLNRISGDRVLLAGDAAGFVNGFSAEGIYYAMVSGEHAGKAAKEALMRRDFSRQLLSRYDAACELEMGTELRESISIQKRMLSNPRRINSMVRLAARSTAMRNLLTSFAVGNISYQDMKKRAAREALPAYLWYQASKLGHSLSSR